jgi:hypothetical protein
MDGEFKKVKDVLPLVVCNATVAKEHASKVECLINTNQGTDLRHCWDSAFQIHPTKAKDGIYILHSALAECLSSKKWSVSDILTMEAPCLLEARLQEALLGAPRHILQGAQ